jgi:hypothetical protein
MASPSISFSKKSNEVYNLALALQALEPVITSMENTRNAKVNIIFIDDGYTTIDVKHMLGSWDFGKWDRWIDSELAANQRPQRDGRVPDRHTLQIRSDKQALRHARYLVDYPDSIGTQVLANSVSISQYYCY